MKTYKICHITTVHPEKDIRIFQKECVSLAQNGFHVTLLVRGKVSDNANNVEIKGIGALPSNRIRRFLYGVNAAYKAAMQQNADLYHIHDPELLFVAWRLARKGKKVLYDSHEDMPRQIMSKHYIPLCLRPMISSIVEKIENYFVKKISGVIAATPVIENRFRKINCQSVSICNYPSLREFDLSTDWAKKEPEVCYVGGIFDVRGGDEMVRMLPLTNVKLNLAGNYSPKSYREKLSKLEGWNKVNEFGFVNREEIKAILNKSIAGLLLLHPLQSYKDSLPIKMFEYMAAGIPVVASDFPLWRSMIQENECGVCCDPLNITEIAEVINQLYSHPEKARKMGENGRKLVLETLNWEAEEIKLVDFYNRILDAE